MADHKKHPRSDTPPEDPSDRLILVLGSGRSGTHLLGRVLDAFPDVEVAMEESPMFELVTRMALDFRERDKFPALAAAYRDRLARAAPRRLADKSHPNLWLVEDLAGAFPHARFVAIQRAPHATVASMLRHGGVLEWQRRWREFPLPNPFLGITRDRAEEYERLPLAAQCALRWQSHAERLRRIAGPLGHRLLSLSYETLVDQPEAEVRRVADFLGLAPPDTLPPVSRDSLDRWKTTLSQEERRQIDQAIDSPDDRFAPHDSATAR